MSSQPPWETQIQPGWGSQPKPPEQPQPPQQQPPQQGGGWNQGSYPPPQTPPMPQPQPPQDRVPYPPFPQQPPPPQFTPPQMPGQGFPGEQPPAKGGAGRIIAIVAAVVVLVGGAGGIYLATKGGKTNNTPSANPSTSTSSTSPASPASPSSSSASFPDNSYTGSSAPPSAASSTGGGPSLDNAATDKTPFTAQALVAPTFNDDKNVAYTLKAAVAKPCDKIGDPLVQGIIKSTKCTDFMAASWIDPQNRIVVSAMIIPLPDATTAAAIYKKLTQTHTGDYSQWCPPAGQPGGDTCAKLAKAGTVTREGKFGNYHRYLLISTAVYVDLRNDETQKDWLIAAAHGAFQATLPGQ